MSDSSIQNTNPISPQKTPVSSFPGSPSTPKRILVVSQHFWPENFRISDIVEGFVDAGMEVDVLCGLPNYPDGEWFQGYTYTGPRRQSYKGAEIFRSGEVRRKGNTSLRIFLNYISFPFFALFTLPRLHGRKYDAVFCYETSPVLMIFPAIVISRLRKIPLTTYVLDLWPENLYSVLPVKNKMVRKITAGISHWHYRKCHRLIAMSNALGERLQDIVSSSKKSHKIAVIPQYCEDFYTKKVSNPEIKAIIPSGFNILFAGNISPAQDLENLVNAMKIVQQSNAKGLPVIRCLIVGDGMSRTTLEETIHNAGLSDMFIFYGRYPAEDIPAWTGYADALFAGLSKSDDLGLTVPGKIPSYFAAGKPMLVAADAEAARAARESGAALVSPAGDSAGLAANIITIAQLQKHDLQKMAEAGKNCYINNYRREPLLKKLIEVITQDS